jgi:transcriptional regulator with XRE-family HTH domain
MDAHISGIKNIGSRLRMVRLEKDHTQTELGEMAGTTQASIQKIENGKSSRPRMIMELAEALDVNPAWLQFGEPFAVRKRP